MTEIKRLHILPIKIFSFDGEDNEVEQPQETIDANTSVDNGEVDENRLPF